MLFENWSSWWLTMAMNSILRQHKCCCVVIVYVCWNFGVVPGTLLILRQLFLLHLGVQPFCLDFQATKYSSLLIKEIAFIRLPYFPAYFLCLSVLKICTRVLDSFAASYECPSDDAKQIYQRNQLYMEQHNASLLDAIVNFVIHENSLQKRP